MLVPYGTHMGSTTSWLLHKIPNVHFLIASDSNLGLCLGGFNHSASESPHTPPTAIAELSRITAAGMPRPLCPPPEQSRQNAL